MDVRREMQAAALAYDNSQRLNVVDIVTKYLKAGADPKYIAHRFGVDLERCLRYVAALTKQQELKREREKSARGDSEVPEVREVVNGAGGAE